MIPEKPKWNPAPLADLDIVERQPSVFKILDLTAALIFAPYLEDNITIHQKIPFDRDCYAVTDTEHV